MEVTAIYRSVYLHSSFCQSLRSYQATQVGGRSQKLTSVDQRTYSSKGALLLRFLLDLVKNLKFKMMTAYFSNIL
jgi:hypothetical protein